MTNDELDALVKKFSPEEWRTKIREEMKHLGLYFKENEIKDSIKCEDCKYHDPMFGVCVNEHVWEVLISKYEICPLYERKENR